MKDFKVTDTLSKTKRDFVPQKPGEVRMYVCGMTVYDLCHLGHARVFVNFDVIVRFLRWSGWKVQYVRNITDIDDKILSRAAETGEDWQHLANRFANEMAADFATLGIDPPDMEPRATSHIADIVAMIQSLADKGYAYQGKNGDYYYRVKHFADYGKLSGRNPDELLAGARVELDPNKEDPRDFALWKAVDAKQVGWDTALGRGRPGWHIECSAMSRFCLGDSFDIHGGGPDLRFPHHENEIAQSEAANGCVYANYWMHAGPLRIDGEKMSKSLDNFFTIREVLEKYHPEVVRFFLISSHYRSAINYSVDQLDEAKQALERYYHAIRPFDDASADVLQVSEHWEAAFADAMADDFNTREALTVLPAMVDEIYRLLREEQAQQAAAVAAKLKYLGGVLGILQVPANEYLQAGSELAADDIEEMIARRNEAKLQKNYALADAIRAELSDKGIQLDDSREGTSWRKV